jgi:type II secretory pathway predicted ATPase ExeA
MCMDQGDPRVDVNEMLQQADRLLALAAEHRTRAEALAAEANKLTILAAETSLAKVHEKRPSGDTPC